MLVKSKGILLHRFKFGESALICKIFTQSHGLVAFIFQGVSAKSSKVKPAHLVPLNILELDFYYHPIKNIKKVKELSCMPVLHYVHLQESKRAFGSFVLEVINRCVREEEPNEELFTFLESIVLELEYKEGVAVWMPHLFLLDLSRILGNGIFATWANDAPFFNFIEGDFVSIFDAKSCFDKSLSLALHHLLCAVEPELAFRKSLLFGLIRFAQYHYIGNAPLKSLAVYQQVGS
jgi:DNA repair protein RecO (recombination protein O)